jgi:hypothetical protein
VFNASSCSGDSCETDHNASIFDPLASKTWHSYESTKYAAWLREDKEGPETGHHCLGSIDRLPFSGYAIHGADHADLNFSSNESKFHPTRTSAVNVLNTNSTGIGLLGLSPPSFADWCSDFDPGLFIVLQDLYYENNKNILDLGSKARKTWSLFVGDHSSKFTSIILICHQNSDLTSLSRSTTR